MQILRGIGVALVTPFNEDLSIDYDGLTRLVDYNISNGIDYLVVMGTTAESATLTVTEKTQVLKHIINVTDAKVPIVLGIGGNNTAAVVAELEGTDLTGVSAILSVTPSYNKPTQEGIYRHFAAIAEASTLPIMLYNVPGRTSSNMLPETVARLANDCKNIVAVKEAVGDMMQILKLLRDVPDDFIVLSGDDALSLSLVAAGGDGVVSVIGQGIPKIFSEVIKEGLNGELEKASQKQLELLEIIDLIFKEGNPAGIKSLLAHLGICKPFVRLPLVEASAALHQAIGSFVSDL